MVRRVMGGSWALKLDVGVGLESLGLYQGWYSRVAGEAVVVLV